MMLHVGEKVLTYISNNVGEYEVNTLTMMTMVLQKSKTLTQNDKVVKEQC